MKIFDFTEGKKGKRLGHQAMDFVGGWILTMANDIKVQVSMNRYDFADKFGKPHEEDQLTTMENVVEKFGVEAVCFCCGKDEYQGTWEWRFLATREWLNNHKHSLTVNRAQ